MACIAASIASFGPSPTTLPPSSTITRVAKTSGAGRWVTIKVVLPARQAASRVRTYIVKRGDTPSAIARQHGVKLEALTAANPSLNPRRLKIGQTLTIPAQ